MANEAEIAWQSYPISRISEPFSKKFRSEQNQMGRQGNQTANLQTNDLTDPMTYNEI